MNSRDDHHVAERLFERSFVRLTRSFRSVSTSGRHGKIDVSWGTHTRRGRKEERLVQALTFISYN
jgi:hypothetical protein